MNDRNQQENVEILVSMSAETWQNTSERRRLEKIIEPLPSLQLFFWSVLVSLTSVINPLLTNLATNLQSQNLYAGWALTQGEVAYANIYGTSGLLYYLVSWLGNLFLGQLLFLLFQVVALTLAGIYLFQTISQITVRSGLARQITILFYLFVLTLGFGGTYSIIFTFPFIFRSLYHLVKYLQGRVRDESFIRFGMVGALAFLIEPAFSLLFYSLTTLFLLLYNIADKRKARGFYQLLASLLGFSLVFYPLGYYTVLNGSFGVAISQVTYVLEAFRLNSSYLLWFAFPRIRFCDSVDDGFCSQRRTNCCAWYALHWFARSSYQLYWSSRPAREGRLSIVDNSAFCLAVTGLVAGYRWRQGWT